MRGSLLNHLRLQENTWESGTARLKVTCDRMSLKPKMLRASTEGSRASATPWEIAEAVSPHAMGVGLAPNKR